MTKTVVMCRAFTESRIEVHVMGTRTGQPICLVSGVDKQILD